MGANPAVKAGWDGTWGHTHTHPVLSRLAEPDQWSELVESKRILGSELGEEVTALAYPVGTSDSFTSVTKKLAETAGYRVAFSYCGGINRPGRFDRFAIPRMCAGRGFIPVPSPRNKLLHDWKRNAVILLIYVHLIHAWRS